MGIKTGGIRRPAATDMAICRKAGKTGCCGGFFLF